MATAPETVGPSEGKDGGEEDTWSMRVLLNTITLSRNDSEEEDDFKTWTQVSWLTRGAENGELWYSHMDGPKAALGRTSTANGFKAAQYNFDRGTKPVPLTSARICEVFESKLEVRSPDP